MITKFLSVLILLTTLAHARSYPVSDHYDGKRFFNIDPYVEKTFADFLIWEATRVRPKWPAKVINKPYSTPELSTETKGIVTFINHSTFLIRLQGLNIITDPVFKHRVSPVSFAGPARIRPPGIEFDNLPKIDVVLISHNHYDHLELDTLVKLNKKFKPLFLVPLGDEKWLRKAGLEHVVEMDWWDAVRVKDSTITFTPTKHWSGRTPTDRFKSLWGAFMVTGPKAQIYFAGDTGYTSQFAEARNRLGPPDLALIPIGAYKPQKMMGVNHIDPDAAVRAHLDLGASLSIGIHYGTFLMADEGFNEPIEDLDKAKIKYGVPKEAFQTLDQGQSFSL
ncbi:MAG TPA: MBL fold metallo-hydrolase [Bacteriovoracaceae bacterium]|nr:MBL fold metallo-hydrolase [Bacteriovoracaceae bacterium]